MKKIMFNDKYGLTQAVLDCRKTMTRRVAVEKPEGLYKFLRFKDQCILFKDGKKIATSHYKVGEVIAIAQNYRSMIENREYWDFLISKRVMRDTDHWIDTWLCESGGHSNKMFVKAEYMPHHIEITHIGMDYLQGISDEDCLREGVFKSEAGNIYGYERNGVRMSGFSTPRDAFKSLINKVAGKGTWSSNPLVWVYEFKLID